MAKKKEKVGIKVKFCGTNSMEVTGSCTHICVGETLLLLECGFYQSCKSVLSNYRINSRKFDFKAKDIQYVFCLHSHLDHVGLLPLLYKRGFRGRIYIPEMNFDLLRILLEDCCHICEKDSELLQRQGYNVEPLYNSDDVKGVLDLCEEIPFYDKITIDNKVVVRLTHSGHITNSAHMEMWLTENNHTKKIYYTSDLGNMSVPTYYVHELEPVNKANLVIAESTYANPKRQIKSKDRAKDLEKIRCVIEQTLDKKGKVLIPVFANHRCQTMLTVLYELFGSDTDWNVPIYVDSPMACKISQLMCHIVNENQMHYWENVMKWKNVHFINEYSDSKMVQDSDVPYIVLASSGMISAGRSVSWTQKLLGSEKNHFLFCGFAPEGSIADKIRNSTQKYITVDGKAIPNKAYATSLVSFSSHIQHDTMLEYYSEINCEKIALVHGNFNDKEKFSKELQETIAKKNKTSKEICVNSSTTINL